MIKNKSFLLLEEILATFSNFFICMNISLPSGNNVIMPEKYPRLDFIDLGYSVLIQRNMIDVTLCVCCA